jgi:predicted cobalt transporter CbtA
VFRRLLKEGVVAGVAGGAALALVLRLIGEGPIGRAVALEGGGHDELFSRGTQQLGGMVAAVVYGAALGAVFALAYALVRHRLRTADDWRASVAVAVAGFAAVFLLPFLKYPANPPAVGDPDTVGRRTALYLVAVAWSLVATWGGWRAWRTLAARGVPVAVPATLIWQFRLATVAGASAFWSVVGMVFGWLRVRDRPDVVVAGVDVHDRA